METATYPHDVLPKAAELPRDNGPPPVRPVAVTLSVPRAQAAKEILAQFKIGEAIAYQRIRDRWSLDQARAEKQEWVQRTYDLLVRLFNSSVVADRCNDWVARLLPEYAPLEDFIELFEVEMRHRLGRLQSVLKRLRDVPDVHQQTLAMRMQVSDPQAEVIPEAEPAADSRQMQAHAMPEPAPRTVETPPPEPAAEPDMTGQVTLREAAESEAEQAPVAEVSAEPVPEPEPEPVAAAVVMPVEQAEPAPAEQAVAVPIEEPKPIEAATVPEPVEQPAMVMPQPVSQAAEAPAPAPASSIEPPTPAPVVESPAPAPVIEPTAGQQPEPAAAAAESQPIDAVYSQWNVVYTTPGLVMSLKPATAEPVAVEQPAATVESTPRFVIRSSAARGPWTLGDFDPML